LNKVKFRNLYLSVPEFTELLSLAQQKRILQKVEDIEWNNDLGWYQFAEMIDYDDEDDSWLAGEDQFHMLLDTIQVALPQIKIIR
jgi:hypothetical protein